MRGMEPTGIVVAVRVAAVVRTDEWTKVKSGRSGIDKAAVDGPVLLTADGVAGDTICDTQHHGGPEQAVYAYSTDDLDFWSAELGRPVTGVGQNLTLAGIDCSGAMLGERWRVGDVELVARAPRVPCRVFAGFLDVPDLVVRFMRARRPGAYLSVERSGHVQAGDGVTVVARPDHGITMADLMGVMSGDRELLPQVVGAREHLGDRGRSWLDRVLGSGVGGTG